MQEQRIEMSDMNDELFEMPFLRNIGFLLTYKCQVSCPHCILEAGPDRTEEMQISNAFEWIRQISNYRNGYIRVLSLTGGEPFYNRRNLREISAFGERNGLFVSVVTNAFWASTQGQAVSILQELRAIKLISISTDVYHLESIPFERVENAIMAARECGIPYTVSVCTENENDRKYKELLEMLSGITEKGTVLTAITFRAGRALKKLSTSNYETSEEPPVSACSAASSPVIFPDGRVIACIGPVIDLAFPHPLVLGNLRESTLHEILENAESNPILHAIRIWGPRKLISIAKEAAVDKYLPERYIKDSLCNACYCLVSNSKIIDFLNQLAKDSEFQRKVAYARAYYLNETRMIELCQLVTND